MNTTIEPALSTTTPSNTYRRRRGSQAATPNTSGKAAKTNRGRADTVAGILRRNLSNPDRVTTKGYGDSHPIASNSTAAGKSQNRRVEVVLQRTY